VTLKGQRIIDSADIIFSSARFVSPEVFKNQKEGGKIYDNFAYSYDEKLQIIKEAVRTGKTTVFVTMGDPCLYGMIGGLGDRLEKAGIEYEIVPGVSAFNASAALIKRGMTGLGLSNTAICTTLHDREDAEAYFDRIAALGASMALFMSVEALDRVVSVLKRHYPDDTAVAIVSKATWPDQKIAQGTLATIEGLVKQKNIADGLILVGEFIDKAYDYDLEREFMERKKKEGRLRQPAPISV
jgi:precorrin-4/cobalt-precorrin-4 C11-methyltransferase